MLDYDRIHLATRILLAAMSDKMALNIDDEAIIVESSFRLADRIIAFDASNPSPLAKADLEAHDGRTRARGQELVDSLERVLTAQRID